MSRGFYRKWISFIPKVGSQTKKSHDRLFERYVVAWKIPCKLALKRQVECWPDYSARITVSRNRYIVKWLVWRTFCTFCSSKPIGTVSYHMLTFGIPLDTVTWLTHQTLYKPGKNVSYTPKMRSWKCIKSVFSIEQCWRFCGPHTQYSYLNDR